jgi:hypothetical protein
MSPTLNSPRAHLAGSLFIGAAACLAGALSCEALPSFARQLNMQCVACHTEFPLLNEFGRQFKLTGYTLAAGSFSLPPIAVMLQPSFTQTQSGQEGGAAPGFAPNSNFALTQASIFYAGRLFGPYSSDVFGTAGGAIADKFGIFSQTTYDGVGKTWSWDNTELRFADTGTWGHQNATYGVYLNNNPTMQDPWNSTPAWGFPFSGSGLAPTPAASPMITGSFAGQVGGLGAYAMVANTVYFDVGAYRTLGPGFQRSVGVDPTGEAQISGLAPYWRFAVEKSSNSSTLELGTFGMVANTYPGRDTSAGNDRTADFGVDSQYQFSSMRSDVTVMASAIYEHDGWSASQPLGATSNATDTLLNEKLAVDYLYDKTYGVAAQVFNVNGSLDPLLYSGSASGSADSNGYIFQLNYMPFNRDGGPAIWSKSNVKFSVQYVVYSHFDGTAVDASANNTLYVEAWIMF